LEDVVLIVSDDRAAVEARIWWASGSPAVDSSAHELETAAATHAPSPRAPPTAPRPGDSPPAPATTAPRRSPPPHRRGAPGTRPATTHASCRSPDHGSDHDAAAANEPLRACGPDAAARSPSLPARHHHSTGTTSGQQRDPTALKHALPDGLTRTQLRDLTHRNATTAQLDQALAALPTTARSPATASSPTGGQPSSGPPPRADRHRLRARATLSQPISEAKRSCQRAARQGRAQRAAKRRS
jgi:hypothetical protein